MADLMDQATPASKTENPSTDSLALLNIAVVLPCLDEGPTIAQVVEDFRRCMPSADIYVFDNGSTDDTAATARQAGAVVKPVAQRGKGNVVRRMFADVDADIYVMADGDDTYEASRGADLVRILVEGGYDVVIGRRVAESEAAFPAGHHLGNRAFNLLFSALFGHPVTDLLSGYQVLSRRFVKSFPAHASGFQVETELALHALELGAPVIEVATVYRSRPSGSVSKLNTVRDGILILGAFLAFLRDLRPLLFFTVVALVFALASLALGAPVLATYLETGLVPRFPTAILATGIMVLAFLSLTCGLILDSVRRSRREAQRLAYLAEPSPGMSKRTRP